MKLPLSILMMASFSCGENIENYNVRSQASSALERIDSYSDQVEVSFDSSTCSQSTDVYEAGSLWLKEENYFACLNASVLSLKDECSANTNQDSASSENSCVTVKQLRNHGLDVPDFDEIEKLSPTHGNGLLAVYSPKQMVLPPGDGGQKGVANNNNQNNKPAPKPVVQKICNDGDDKSNDINHGKAIYKCQNNSWVFNRVSCHSDTNQYDYKANGDKCERRDISECSGRDKKSRNISYGKIEYECKNYRWVVDSVKCNKEDNNYRYKRSGDSCKREQKKSCRDSLLGTISHGDTKSVSVAGGKLKGSCNDGKLKKELECKSGLRKVGGHMCI